MDILRKELNEFYEGQRLAAESLDYSLLDECVASVAAVTGIERDCRVITDAARDRCVVMGGALGRLIGLSDDEGYVTEVCSSDEDEIYSRIHPEDLVEKRMLEYEFFKCVDRQSAASKLDYKATSHIRVLSREGSYLYVDNSTRLLRLSPNGKAWLILCCYAISSLQESLDGISPRIINMRSGEVMPLRLSDRRARILTDREKEVLTLIRDGKLSKQIAEKLHISVHTVNRHRQNILEKLSVGNSVEAVTAATLMRLL